MSDELEIGDLRFHLTRSERRATIGVSVGPSGVLAIRAPAAASDDEIARRVRARMGWVRRKLAEVTSSAKLSRKFDLGSGRVPYMGRVYSVTESPSRPTGVYRGSIHCSSLPGAGRADELVGWYKIMAKEKLTREISELTVLYDDDPPGMKVLELGARWGSCSTDGTINLNWKLILLPRSSREYVIHHELAHLKVHDHSNSYWRHLGRHLTDWAERKAELEKTELMFQIV